MIDFYPVPSRIQRQLLIEKITSLRFGQFDRDHPLIIPANAYSRGVNVETRGTGLFTTRRGSYLRVNSPEAGVAQGGFFYEPTAGSGMIVTAHNGKLYWWGNSGDDWHRIGTLVLNNREHPVNFLVSQVGAIARALIILAGIDDHVYYWNGANTTNSPVPFADSESDFPRGTHMTSQASRILVAGNQALPDSIIASPIARGLGHVGDGQWAQNVSNLALDTPGREKSTTIVKYRKDQAVGFTKGSSHLLLNLSDSNQENWSVEVIDPTYGTESPWSVVVAADDGFFLDTGKRYRSIKRSSLSEVTGVDESISQYNPNLFDRIHQPRAHLAAATLFDDYILLAAPLDLAQENNRVIAMDLGCRVPSESGQSNIPALVSEFTGWYVKQWIPANFSGKRRLFFQSNVDGSLQEAFVGHDDNNVYPEWQVDLRGIGFGKNETMKTPLWGEVQYEDSYGNITVNYAADDRIFKTTPQRGPVNVNPNNPQFPVTFPVMFGAPKNDRIKFYFRGENRNRMTQLRLSGDSGHFNIRDVTLFGKPHNINKRD